MSGERAISGDGGARPIGPGSGGSSPLRQEGRERAVSATSISGSVGPISLLSCALASVQKAADPSGINGGGDVSGGASGQAAGSWIARRTVERDSDHTANLCSGSERRAFVGAYEKKYAINPFRRVQGSDFLQSRSHNRRRWSHVFPQGSSERDVYVHFGLNWKSLTQPAILPLDTDYVPTVEHLMSTYTRSTYNLILDPLECPFASPEALLTEMVSQRLAQEFQLVEKNKPFG